jgi:Multicopper oxidase
VNTNALCNFRWNLSAGAARPNPQGSFRYASINVTQAFLLRNEPPVVINGKRRATLNGISYVPPQTPLRLADQYNLKGVYTLDFPERPLKGSPKLGRSIINGTYRGFMELIFQNNDTKIQSYHMDGYAFFVVGYELNLIEFLTPKHVIFLMQNVIFFVCLYNQDGLWGMDREQQRHLQQR